MRERETDGGRGVPGGVRGWSAGGGVPPGHRRPSRQATQRPSFGIRKLPSSHSHSSTEVAPSHGVVCLGSGQRTHAAVALLPAFFFCPPMLEALGVFEALEAFEALET